MRISITLREGGARVAIGRHISDQYSYQFSHPLHPGQPYAGIPWDELATLSAIVTDDAGPVVEKVPRTPDPNMPPPAFVRRA